VIVGSPQTVVEKYEAMIEDLGIGMVMSAGGHIGSMPNWMVLKNMQIMAEEVFPHFRAADGQPGWARQEPAVPQTHSGFAAQVPPPALAPKARVNGGYLDGRTGHLPEVADRLDEVLTR